MTGTPPSLASVLHIPPEEHGTTNDELHDDDSSAAVLTYLSETYQDADQLGFKASSNPATPAIRRAHSVNNGTADGQYPIRRSLSPVDPSVEIDPSIAAFAQNAADSVASLELVSPSYGYPPIIDTYGSLGEMGGKRKKMPHERAGWVEMDESGPKKRGRKKGEGKGFVGTGPAASGESAAGSGGEGSKIEAAAPTAQETKESRAEQNRRAQQAFRRRREERMRDLESAAAALEPLQHRMVDAENKLLEAAVANEAAHTEIAVLRAALKFVAAHSGSPVLTAEGRLATDSSHGLKSGASSPSELEAAFVSVEKQARELAKNRRRG